MSKNKVSIQFALALLVGMFILSGILLNIAIGEDEVINIDLNEDEEIDVVVTLTTEIEFSNKVKNAEKEKIKNSITFSKSHSYDLEALSGWVSVSGTRIDAEGNRMGGASISGGIEVTIDDDNNASATYWAYASSFVTGDNIGRGNAWVHLPKAKIARHAYGRGDFWVYKNDPLNAWDTNTVANPGGRVMKASAALSLEGARITVGFKVDGI